MNKKTIIDRIASEVKLSKKDVTEVVDAVFEEIVKGIAEEEVVDISGFGKFTVRERAARKGVNPKTLETIDIPASKSVGFKISKRFKELLKK